MPPRRRRQQEGEPQIGSVAHPFTIVGPPHWEEADELPVLYVDQLFMQGTGGAILLTFGLTSVPLEGITPELQERIRNEGLRVKALARIAISPQRLRSFVDVLNGALEEQAVSEQSTSEESNL
jgi:hypothetical protein